MTNQLLTIGHSTHSVDHFLELIRMHNVQVLCDVRSTPYSRFNPGFNRAELQASLAQFRVTYLFLGNALGARPTDSFCFENGRVSYDTLAKTNAFRMGLARVMSDVQRFNVSLMCAEKDPLDCHRAILICRHLRSPDINIAHILDDGRLESHEHAESRLVASLGTNQGELFSDTLCDVERAYDIQARRIAFSIEGEASTASAEV